MYAQTQRLYGASKHNCKASVRTLTTTGKLRSRRVLQSQPASRPRLPTFGKPFTLHNNVTRPVGSLGASQVHWSLADKYKIGSSLKQLPLKQEPGTEPEKQPESQWLDSINLRVLTDQGKESVAL